MTLGLLHTADVHVRRFDALVADLAPRTPVVHHVDPPLLQRALDAGCVADEIVSAVHDRLDALLAAGSRTVLCTCSTLGGAAEGHGPRVLRVDRPMAEAAARIGGKVAIVAAVQSTLEPTCALFRSVLGDAAEIEPVVSRDAWSHFERGDLHAYLDAIAATARAVAPGCSAVVLAQVSMADAAGRLSDLDVPVLSSPRSGLEAALAVHDSTHAEQEVP